MKTYSLSIRREIKAPVEKVFAAWTNQNMAKQWFSPESDTVAEAEIEAKVGGVYRIVMAHPDRGLAEAIGEIKELVPNKKLVFTWNWQGKFDKFSDGETMLSLDFKPLGQNQTELIFTQTQLKSQESADAHTKGWNSCLNRLETLVKS